MHLANPIQTERIRERGALPNQPLERTPPRCALRRRSTAR